MDSKLQYLHVFILDGRLPGYSSVVRYVLTKVSELTASVITRLHCASSQKTAT